MPAVTRQAGILLGLAALVARADVADDFKNYVNEVLPRTHEITKQSAKLIERAAIHDRVSVAQSHLDLASRDVVELNAQLMKLEEPSFFEAEISDPGKALHQIAVLSQVVNFVSRIRSHVDKFDAIMTGLGPHCEEGSAFVNYNIDTLQLAFTVPDYNVFTGVKVGIAISSGGSVTPSSQGGNEESIPIVGPIITFFKNRSIRNRISEEADRLRREQPSTDTYRKYAQEVCRSLSVEANKELKPYNDFSSSMRKFADAVPLAKLSDLKGYLRELVAQYEKAQAEVLSEEVRTAAAQWMKPAEQAHFQTKLGIQTNERLNLNLARLEKAECNKGLALVEDIEADLALSETYELRNRERLLPTVRKRLAERKKRCPEEMP